MMSEEFFDLPELELVKLCYYGVFSVSRWHHANSFLLAFCLHKEPGFMYTIQTTPVSIYKKMGTCPQNYCYGAEAFKFVGTVRDFYQILWHDFLLLCKCRGSIIYKLVYLDFRQSGHSSRLNLRPKI